jgi:ABC-type phosphate transport system substrate-binding protein
MNEMTPKLSKPEERTGATELDDVQEEGEREPEQPHGKNAYPISSFTWMLVPTQIPDARKASAIKAFL